MAAIETAKVLLGSMPAWSRRINDQAVSELLELKNASWLAEDEPAISSVEFLNRMQVTSMTVYPDGSFEWHEDGDMFWGHAILVSGSLALGVTHAHIAG